MSDATYEAIATYSQVVAAVLFIVVVVYLWNRFISPAVLASQARKNAELLDSEKRRDDARAELERAQAEVDRAEADVRAIAARAETDATRLHEKAIAEARAEGERLMNGAHGELARSRETARTHLRDELLERAMQIARDAASRLDETTNRRLVGEAVDTAERGGHG
jgi:F0F1-type ATP synthase membrane subunit b/b'